jgi:glycosyltransferase involved in cell wall biosynthesis
LNQAIFAVPGALDTPTGGYAYARRLLAEAPGLTHLALPGGYPFPAEAEIAESARRLLALPPGQPVLIDGLALGVLPAELLRRLPGPVLALCHHPLALETGVSAADAARFRDTECAALAASAHVLTTSATTAAILTADFGVPPARLTVAPPGTDPAPRANGSGGPSVAILAVASLTPRKGHDVLVAALAGLADLDWTLTIAGPGRDAACARDLQALIARHGLEHRIRLSGPLDADELEQAYSGADLFVLASRYEGFGMVYAEAMARGLATVGTSAGAIPEATRGGARLVAPEDPDALRQALGGLIADGAARRQLADACWQAAQGFTRWPDTARIVLGALRGAAG